MLVGKNLQELAKELEHIRDTARDFIVPTKQLKAVAKEKVVTLNFDNKAFQLNDHSSNQVAGRTKIPQQYFQKLALENPGLLADNINHGLRNMEDRQFQNKERIASNMVRTVEQAGVQVVRGFMSDRFRALDNHELFESVFPTFKKHGLQVVSSEITQYRMYIKVLSPSLKSKIKDVNDIVQYGLVISNSDVGAGSVRVEPLIYRLVCKNGMITNTAMRKYHVGRSQSEEEAYELFTEKTRNMDNKAFWAKVKDLVEGSLKPENFEKEVDRFRLAANQKIISKDAEKVVEVTMKTIGLSGEDKKKSILSALATGNEGAGYTKYGLVNSFTRVAHEDTALDYEGSIQMERAAGEIMALTEKQWERIANVA